VNDGGVLLGMALCLVTCVGGRRCAQVSFTSSVGGCCSDVAGASVICEWTWRVLGWWGEFLRNTLGPKFALWWHLRWGDSVFPALDEAACSRWQGLRRSNVRSLSLCESDHETMFLL